MPTAWEILNAAFEHHRAGRFDEAERLYREALEVEADLPHAYYYLGLLSAQLNRHDAAVEWYQKSLAIDPSNADGWNNVGNSLRAVAKLVEAERVYRRALSIKPDFPEAMCNLGLTLHEQNRPEEAAEYYRQALKLAPQLAAIHHNLGNSQRASGDLEAAVVSYRTAVACDPNLVESLNNLGIVLNDLGDTEQAVEAYRRALRLAPHYLDVYNNLGCVLKRRFDYPAACDLFRECIKHRPDRVEGYVNLIATLLDDFRFAEALTEAEQAYAKWPDRLVSMLVNTKQLVCDWKNIENLCEQVVAQVESQRYSDPRDATPPFLFCGLAIPTLPRQQWLCARAWAGGVVKSSPIERRRSRVTANLSIKKRIRIGYMSADFRIHAVAYMLPELLESHNRNDFEIFGYSLFPDDGSEIRKRLVAGCDHFRDVTQLSDRSAAELIVADEIDILVDLQGYTSPGRTEILAMRPAPIQVAYLGYPGTMGADFIDYILADEYVVPKDQAEYYVEKPVYLPGCYQVNDSRHAVDSRRPTRSECSLPEEAFVFCSFNNCYKLNPALFDVWMNLLKRVPDSVLWLTPQERTAYDNLRREAEVRGVSADRLVFAQKLPIDRHLARQPLADLFLDSFPYNAHATASIALRMGVPLVTRSGQSMASRVAGSLLRTLNLSELITHDFAAYEALAFRLAEDPGYYTSIRRRLEVELKSTPLFDGAAFAVNLEQAYREMWRLHGQGEKPRPIHVARPGARTVAQPTEPE